MTKRSRNRVRSRGKLILNSYNQMVSHYAYRQPSEKWQDWTAMRTISLHQAQIKEAAGEVVRITRMLDGVVEIVGFRDKESTRPGEATPGTLTDDTMVAVANYGVPTKEKYALTSGDRRHIAKFKVYAFIGDTKAMCTRPRTSLAERTYAEGLLGVGSRIGLKIVRAAAVATAA